MTESERRLLEGVLPRLRLADAVQGALARLAEHGHTETADIRRLAFDNTSPMQSRLDAVTLLTAMKDPDEEAIHGLFAIENETLFIETVKSMKSLSVEWALQWELVAARDTNDPSRRALIAWALAAYPTSVDAETSLLNLATNDDSPTVREHAIEALGEFHSSAVVKVLLDILSRGLPTERFWALFSLGNLAAPVAAEGVRSCLQDYTAIPGFGTIAEEASWALARIQEGRFGAGGEP
jgi:HEAT repeat protein